MRKAYNVVFCDYSFNTLVDCEIWANNQDDAIEKARDVFKYRLYGKTYFSKVKAM